MKRKLTTIIMALAVIGAGLATQANAVTFTFQENGSNLSLGPTSATLSSLRYLRFRLAISRRSLAGA